VYYSSLIVFFGASLTRAAIRQRGHPLVPKSTAVRVRRELIEDANDGAMTTATGMK
jgi:membrane protein